MKSIITAILLSVTLTSCLSGSKAARDEGLMPAARLAWGNAEYGVLSDTQRGIADAVEDGDLTDDAALQGFVGSMSSALEADDRAALRTVPWSVLSPYAARGIDDRVEDGEMVEQAAVFLRRRLENFDRAIETLTDPAYAYVPPGTDFYRARGASRATPSGSVPLVAVAVR